MGAPAWTLVPLIPLARVNNSQSKANVTQTENRNSLRIISLKLFCFLLPKAKLKHHYCSVGLYWRLSSETSANKNLSFHLTNIDPSACVFSNVLSPLLVTESLSDNIPWLGDRQPLPPTPLPPPPRVAQKLPGHSGEEEMQHNSCPSEVCAKGQHTAPLMLRSPKTGCGPHSHPPLLSLGGSIPLPLEPPMGHS